MVAKRAAKAKAKRRPMATGERPYMRKMLYGGRNG